VDKKCHSDLSKGAHVERGEVISRAERRKLSRGGIRRKSRKAGPGQSQESSQLTIPQHLVPKDLEIDS
jgi:hypothetical protein